MKHLLDNIFWHTLIGPHARYAEGSGDARRYARGFSPMLGFADAERPDFGALAPYCDPGEHFYCGGWTGAAPAGWRIDAESTMFRMVWDAAIPSTDEIPEAIKVPPGLSPRDAISAYVSSTGAASVRAALGSGRGAAYDSARVTSARVEPISIAGIEYLAALLDVEIMGGQ